jgi:predicted ATPase/class 3 adenylate cyclase
VPDERRSGFPSGTVTFLFTDIEGSTRLLTALGDRYPAVLDRHEKILESAIAAHGGMPVETRGDAYFAVFPSAVDAIAAAADGQRHLADADWPEGKAVRVRMGLHTGEAQPGGTGYVGIDVYRAARIAAAGHGGQVLLSDATRGLVEQALPLGVTLRELGDHRLKDLPAPERLWQLDIEGLPAEFPALLSLDQRPNNLPLSITPLIGREKELADVVDLLAQRRLLTLTGPGGTGKTRVALAVAQQTLTDFADGAFFVPLEDAVDRTAVAGAIASALGVRESLERDLEQGVQAFLRDRELLLILDNFEQVLDAAPLVTDLLAHAPGLRVIATSRSVLHLSGEQDYEVPPLSLPDPHQLPELAALRQYEALALFIERAQAVQPDFEVNEGNASAVAEICARLDGLPLAIELAAARARLLTPQAILDRLERRLPLLTGGAQDRPDRQRTLRSAIDWSYELLDASGRPLFERLAAFAGGWSINAADEVCNPRAELGIDTLDGMAALTDESLIRPSLAGDGPGGNGTHGSGAAGSGDSGEPRFEMLQVIREFAGEKLDAGADAEEIRRRHARHFLSLADEAEPHLVRADLRRWQDRLRREEENLRTALRWALDRGEAELGLFMAGALWRFWHYWGEFREGARWLESFLALPDAAAPTQARARGLSALAGIRFWQGDVPQATVLYEEALPIYRQVGDDRQIAEAYFTSAWAALVREDFATARERGEAALEHYRRADDRVGLALVTAWLRTGEYLTGLGGDAKSAVAAAKEAVSVFRDMGTRYDEADWLGTLAMVYERAGDHAKAWEVFREAVQVNLQIRNLGALPWFKFGAKLELARGRPERAARLAAVAQRSIEESGGELPVLITGGGDPLADARSVLPAEAYERAVAEGRAMTIDQAVAYVLEDE